MGGRKNDRSRKATARNAAMQAKKETERLIERILKGQNRDKGEMRHAN